MGRMNHRWLFAVAMLGACATEPDTRKATSDVVVLEIMKPTCGQVQCHSRTTQISGYILDDIHGAEVTIAARPGDVIGAIEPGAEEPMPPDFPLDPRDRQLIIDWIDNGMPDSVP